MIRRTLRLGVRLGLITGIGLALFKLIQGRRSASELGSPSADWAPPPVPNPNLPKSPPEPDLITPVMLEEVIEKKAAVQSPPPEVTIEPAPAPAPKAPARKAPARKVTPAAAGPVKKVAPKKAAAKKASAKNAAPAADVPMAKVASKKAPARKRTD